MPGVNRIVFIRLNITKMTMVVIELSRGWKEEQPKQEKWQNIFKTNFHQLRNYKYY